MTIRVFNQLPIEKQRQYIGGYGILLKDRQVGQWTYYLYAINAGFVELCYDRKSGQLASCQAFTDLERLEFYLADMHLEIHW